MNGLLFSSAKNCLTFVFQRRDSNIVTMKRLFTAPAANSLVLVLKMRPDASTCSSA
jgi:hypothetical protein